MLSTELKSKNVLHEVDINQLEQEFGGVSRCTLMWACCAGQAGNYIADMAMNGMSSSDPAGACKLYRKYCS